MQTGRGPQRGPLADTSTPDLWPAVLWGQISVSRPRVGRLAMVAPEASVLGFERVY